MIAGHAAFSLRQGQAGSRQDTASLIVVKAQGLRVLQTADNSLLMPQETIITHSREAEPPNKVYS
ncbi:MAG: hypothetical protein CML06_01465 [Pseudomonadales bacterium]|nr:hypothetical protein [Pseudomonadales bacterium]